jgi:hypothetical protein
VFASLRRVTVAGRYPMAAMAIAFAAIAGEPGMTGPAGQPPPSTVSRAGAVWAVNASGQKVPVTKPTFVPTPIHPESSPTRVRTTWGQSTLPMRRGAVPK